MAERKKGSSKKRDPANVPIGKRIRFVRQNKNLTLDKLSEAADTSTQFLSQLEKGEQAMTMVKFGRLSTALGVSSDYLLFGRSEVSERAAYAAEILASMNPIEVDILSQVLINLRCILDELSPEHG